MLDHIHNTKPQPCDYAKVQAFIEDNGYRAYVTKEGLLAFSERWAGADQCPDVAEWLDMPERIEVPAVFPIDDAGRVDSRAVRLWLGY